MIGFGLFIICLLPATCALLFSILSWRLKTEVMFWLGVLFTAILFFILSLNYKEILFLFSSPDELFPGVILMACLIIPICFLVASKLKPDKAHADSDVTDEYLNDIINSEDEDGDLE